jgi:hypothetical protein
VASLFQSEEFLRRERSWNREASAILTGITDLVEHYPPAQLGRYSREEIAYFVRRASIDQIGMRAPGFTAARSPDSVLVEGFPSVKMMSFSVFFKFYPDRRKPSVSDVFDVIISAAVPYVDLVITERHQAEVLRRTKDQDEFIREVEVYTIRDLR